MSLDGGGSHLLVVGGGISGLAAAWEWSRAAGRTVTVLEASERPGGKLRTTPFAGRMVDEGADTFLRRVPDALALCEQIGLRSLRSPAEAGARIWIDHALRRLPTGTVLGVPITDAAAGTEDLLSAAARARVTAEAERAGPGIEGDVALGPYLRDHLGDEVVDHLVEPLLGGIYAGRLDDMSLDATAPQLAAAAHRGASLVRGLREARADAGSGAVFSAPADGMGTLVAHLVAALEAHGGEVRTGVEVRQLGGLDGPTPATVDTGAGTFEGDAVLLAVPPARAAALVAPHAPDAGEMLGGIATVGVVVATLAVRIDDLGVPLDATGFLVPRTAPGLRITAASWATTKWPDLARDDGLALLRVSLGHAGDRVAVELDDDAVLEVVRRDLMTTMGLRDGPAAVRLSRWSDGFPQYQVGHLDRIATVEADLATTLPRLALAGAMCRGVGIPACIRQGRAAAAALAARGSAVVR